METLEISVWYYFIDNFERDFTSKANTFTLMDYLELGDNPQENPEIIYLEVFLRELFIKESSPKWR